MDERLGRAVASRFDLNYIGLLGVLVVAKQSGVIDAVKPLMNDLRTIAGFWIHQKLYKKILNIVGE